MEEEEFSTLEEMTARVNELMAMRETGEINKDGPLYYSFFGLDVVREYNFVPVERVTEYALRSEAKMRKKHERTRSRIGNRNPKASRLV